jgi:hypothetical protein
MLHHCRWSLVDDNLIGMIEINYSTVSAFAGTGHLLSPDAQAYSTIEINGGLD